MIYGLQDFFFLATWWVGYFFTAVQEFFSITFVLHAIFFFRQALAGNFFSKSPTPPQELNGRPLISLFVKKNGNDRYNKLISLLMKA